MPQPRTTKKAASKKASSKKAPSKKAPSKKAPAKKAPAKKAPAKKAPARKTASASKPASAARSAAKKTAGAAKSAAKKTTRAAKAATTGAKAGAKAAKTSAKKSAAGAKGGRATAKKASSKKAGASRSTSRSTTAKKPAAKKPAAKKRPAAKRASGGRKKSGSTGTPPSTGGGDSTTARLRTPADLVALSRSRAQELFDDAVDRGRMTRTDATDLLGELLRGAREGVEGVVSTDRVRREVDRARRATGIASFPISGYDDLSSAQVSSRLGDLSSSELRKVRDYERRNANRKSVLDAIERRLGQ